MVTPITLPSFAASDTDYVAKLNNLAATCQGKINELVSLYNAVLGDGAELVVDLWDRPGVLGVHSYVLDLTTYSGGSQITIGRRPAPDLMKGDRDVSVAWGSFSGAMSRITLTGDLELDAAGITGGLPKTIYVGIPANGTPQLFESNAFPNVLYVYSMTWDGYNLEDVKRLSHILPSYSLLQALAGAPRLLQLFDADTDWVSDDVAASEIVIPGDAESNGVFEGSMEVVGFFLHAGKEGDDGFSAPVGEDFADTGLTLRVTSEGETWSAEDIEIDCGNVPDSVFVGVNSVVGDEKYVTEVRRFTLERVSVGGNVVSASNFSWGVVVRPVLGIAVPRDPAKVDQI